MEYYNVLKQLKDFFERSGTSFEYQTPEQLIKIVNSLNSYSSIVERYSFALNDDKEESEPVEENIGFFECRLPGFFDISKKDVDEYCAANQLSQCGISYFQLEGQARCWFDKQLNEKLVTSLETIKGSKYSNIYLVHKSESSKFLELFKEEKFIDWSALSSDKHFDWSEEIIETGKDSWDWDALTFNKAIKWTVELVDKFKYYINWFYISSYDLGWDITLIKRFKEYIVFTKAGKCGWKRKDKSSQPAAAFNKYANDKNIIGNISANEYIVWTDALISEFEELWNWTYLSQNEAIEWTDSLIEKYQFKIDYSALSKNKKVNWNSDFINKYSDKLNFHALVRNPSVVWSAVLMERYLDRVEIIDFAKWANITSEGISAFESLWDKTDTVRHYARRNSDGSYHYHTTHTLWEYLCQNRNIIWTDELINRHLSKIPLKDLNDKRICISVETINKYWDYNRYEMVDYWENYDGDEYPTYEYIYFRNKVRDAAIKGITLDKFLENEIRWLGVLNTPEFLNRSIKSVVKGLQA